MNLHELQAEHMAWLERNFPQQQNHDPLLGLVEEVGELAHAHLKAAQSIRGMPQEHRADAIDAIGDIVIFLASYCNSNGFDLESAVVETWHKVKQRDWQRYPQDGEGV